MRFGLLDVNTAWGNRVQLWLSVINKSIEMITIYFDGGAKPNPGIGYGSYLINDDTQPLTPHGTYRQTWKAPFTSLPNNQAEYLTLWLALHDFVDKFDPFENLHIYSDSQLLVKQVKGEWRVKDKHLKIIHAKITELLRHIPYWSIYWNPREVNIEKFGH